MAKKNKISIINLERERFSNFVVDLRVKENVANKIIKKEHKNLSQSFLRKLKSFKIVVKKIKPNLLATINLSDFSPKTERIKVKAINTKSARKTDDYPWLKFIREQERIFNTPAKPNYNRQKKAFLNSKNFKVSNIIKTKKFWRHPLFLFVLVLILIILSFQAFSGWPLNSFNHWEAKITGRSTLAINNLVAATNFATQLNFKEADANFQAASANFLAASSKLDKINSTILSLAVLSNKPKIKLAAESKKFLNSGVLVANLGRNLILATNSLFNTKENNLAKILDNFLFYGNKALRNAQELKDEVNKIDTTNIPTVYRPKFISLKKQINLFADNLTSFMKLAKDLKIILGLSRDKRYLLVFQNNAEMRASGGFIGSYALVDLSAGKITNLEVPGGGSYDTAGGMEVKVVAPQALWLVNPLWHFWDANWWPDWPTTAKNLMWFYEKSGGPSVDGVISITPTVVERLLKITGPIDLRPQYNLTITADNFWTTVQNISEQNNLTKIKSPIETTRKLPLVNTAKFKSSNIPLQQGLSVNSAHKPKKIIGDLMVKILEILPKKFTKDNLLSIITLFQKDLSEKQVLFYFTNPKLESMALSNNWAGKVQASSRDYLLVVNTNIAGQKTDRVISQKIKEISKVDNNGSIIDTVQIIRTHHGVKGTPLTGVRNVDWLRVYVPLGSKLLSASGFKRPAKKYLERKPDSNWENLPVLAKERAASIDPNSLTKIYQEDGKTVFANWSMLDPGETITITLRYRLPFNFFTPPTNTSYLKKIVSWLNPNFTPPLVYSLMVQKQAGAKASEFSSRLILPNKWSIFWSYPLNLKGLTGWDIKDKLASDKYYVVLLKRAIKS